MTTPCMQQTKRAIEERLNAVFDIYSSNIAVTFEQDAGGADSISIKGESSFFGMALTAYKADLRNASGARRARALRLAWPFKSALQAGREETDVIIEIDYIAHYLGHNSEGPYAISSQTCISDAFPVKVLYEDRVAALLKSPDVCTALHEQSVRQDDFLESVRIDAIDVISRVMAGVIAPGCPQSVKDS